MEPHYVLIYGDIRINFWDDERPDGLYTTVKVDGNPDVQFGPAPIAEVAAWMNGFMAGDKLALQICPYRKGVAA